MRASEVLASQARRPRPPLGRQLTERAALSESLREPGEMAPDGALQARRQLSVHPGREPVFAQHWPFRADSRVDGSQPEGAGFRWNGYGSSGGTRICSPSVNSRPS